MWVQSENYIGRSTTSSFNRQSRVFISSFKWVNASRAVCKCIVAQWCLMHSVNCPWDSEIVLGPSSCSCVNTASQITETSDVRRKSKQSCDSFEPMVSWPTDLYLNRKLLIDMYRILRLMISVDASLFLVFMNDLVECCKHGENFLDADDS